MEVVCWVEEGCDGDMSGAGTSEGKLALAFGSLRGTGCHVTSYDGHSVLASPARHRWVLGAAGETV